jgi:DNA-binding SARP family transcriptional activator
MADNNLSSPKQYSIYTLGKFIVQRGDSILSENTSRSRRMWEVFKYILSNPGKALLPETILENIWPEKEYTDPRTVMRAFMFRLRQALKEEDRGHSLTENIVFAQGCYRWENNVECWIDFSHFEALFEQARSVESKNPDAAAQLFREAIAVYKGEYLPESSFSEWVIPLRTYYHDIYLSSVFSLVELLKIKHDYSEIVKVCEQAASIDYYEEKIHIYLIEALLAEGLTNRAKVHYNEVTSTYYREMGIKPSGALKDIYRLIVTETGSFEFDLGTIQEGLKNDGASRKAFLCDPGLFRYFYNLERLRAERSGQSALLSLLTVTKTDYKMPSPEKIKETMDKLQDVILGSLRKGDIVTRWNDAQYLLLLPGLSREKASEVLKRIEENYLKLHSLDGLSLHKKTETLLPLEDDAHFN